MALDKNTIKKITFQFFLLLIKEDLLVNAYLLLVFAACLVHTFGGGIDFFESTVDDFPSIILITLPSVDGLTRIGRGYSHYSFCSIPIIGAYFHLCYFDSVFTFPM